MKEQSYIYFLTNTYNNVLYIGVTNNIIRRVAEHKAKINKGFTYKYNCDRLVYYEIFTLMTDAISREKQLKNWKREWKNKLVNDFNSEWKDLSEEIGVTNEMIEAVKTHYAYHSATERDPQSPDEQSKRDPQSSDDQSERHCGLDPQSPKTTGGSDFRQNDGRDEHQENEIRQLKNEENE